ncbi:MAG: hypothetical protein F4087_06485 [Gemmatimonadetes bacterium]|nr:hypothetical protein [Gemmatimonadota bacterium]MYE71356.1 hypothetical protein [Gemmatimonadota bacterium]MYJ68143.1 hypothetical protein [Gemmatimonadota bacterium]
MKTGLATLLILLTVAPLAGQERRLPTPAVARPTPSVGPLGGTTAAEAIERLLSGPDRAP